MSYAGVPEAPPLAPFLKRSAAFHAALLAAAVILPGRSGAPPQQVYRIDFIGGSDVIMNRRSGGAPAAAAPEPAAAKPEKQKDPDSFNLKPSFKHLPKPSFLDAARPDKAPKPSALKPSFIGTGNNAPSAAAASALSQGTQGAGSGAGIGSVSADMPDFPYPWYLTSLRQKLWDRWSDNMPSFPGEALVMFTILRDGSLVDVRIEETSGERSLDYAALSAVRASGPLPPLPPAFREKFLTVHVQFKSN